MYLASSTHLLMYTSISSSRTLCMKRLLTLLLSFAFPLLLPAQQETLLRAKEAQKLFSQLAESHAYTNDLNQVNLGHLPIGVKRTINGLGVTIAVNSFTIDKEGHTRLGIYAEVILPLEGGERKRLLFGIEGATASSRGSLPSEAKLILLEDLHLPFVSGSKLILRSPHGEARNSTHNGTYLKIGCEGFKALGLDAEVLFSKELLKVAGTNEPVRAHFQTEVEGWKDLLVEATLPAFEIKGLPGFEFGLHQVTLDLSDTQNSPSVQYPNGYEAKYLHNWKQGSWRGLYAEEVSVTLPKAFARRDAKRITFMAKHLLIDDQGITGAFSAEQLLPLSEGTAGGWDFSVNQFGLNLEANKLVSATFSGYIGLPFTGKNTSLAYTGVINPDNEYNLRVSPKEEDSLDFSLFNAKAKLLPNSYVQLAYRDGHFFPTAVLHGEMTLLDSNQGGSTTILPKVSFRGLRLQTESPYLSIEHLGYEGQAELGSLPLSIRKLELTSKSDEVELMAKASVTLGEKLFSGQTTLRFQAHREVKDGHDRWICDGVKVDDINLDAHIAELIRLKGQLAFHRNDPIFGDGFTGDVDLTLEKLGNLQVHTRGAFGHKKDFRYWFAEGGAVFPSGVPIFTGVSIQGLSCGVTQRMRAEGKEGGKTRYLPDASMGLGFKAAVNFRVGEKVATGEGALEFAFNRHGGLNYAGLFAYAQFPAEGQATMKLPSAADLNRAYANLLKKEQAFSSKTLEKWRMSDPHRATRELAPIPSSLNYGIRGSLTASFDFRAKAFHAMTELYVTGKFIEGIGEGGRAGWGVLHADPKEWYLHLGSPADPISLRLGLAGLASVESRSYLMAGSQIPDMPDPPSEVLSLLSIPPTTLRNAGRSPQELALGRGLAFGSRLQVSTGDLTFLMLYARFQAGLGFDAMLREYSTETECEGRSGRIGLNGWYARGQAYAYLQGELGVKVRLFFIKGRFPILRGGAAALLQAGLPNPSYFRGYLGVKFSILGGLVSGNTRFRLSLGEECRITTPGGSPIERPLISDLAPQHLAERVSVFSMPEVRLNIAEGKVFHSNDEDGEKLYRVRLKHFRVQDEQGQEILGKLTWNKTRDALTFHPQEILPQKSKLHAEVAVGFEEQKENTWRTVYTGGREAIERKQCTFMTGDAPQEIPLQNVVYSYPIIGQKYLFTKQVAEGYIQLKVGQHYLFDRGFSYELQLENERGEILRTPLQYNETQKRITFRLPTLLPRMNYTARLSFVSGKTNERDADKAKEVYTDSEGGSIKVTERRAEALLSKELEGHLLSFDFATSRHADFISKINSLTAQSRSALERLPHADRILLFVSGEEAFDEAELIGGGTNGSQPLISVRASLDEPYYKESLPLVYAGYPYGSIRLRYRTEKPYGIPPHYALPLLPRYRMLLQNEAGVPRSFVFPFGYDIGEVIHADFYDLLPQVLNRNRHVPQDVFQRFAFGRPKVLHNGHYRIILSYTLPGETKPIAETECSYNNFSNLND